MIPKERAEDFAWVAKGRGRWEAWYRSVVCFVIEFVDGPFKITGHVDGKKVWSAQTRTKALAESAAVEMAPSLYENA